MNSNISTAFDILCAEFFYPRVKQFDFNPLGIKPQKENLIVRPISIENTLEQMRYFIVKMIDDPDFHEATMKIIKYAKGRYELSNVEVEREQVFFIYEFYKKFYEWMVHSIQYVHDAINNEHVRNPLLTLFYGGADCDDFVTTYCSGNACAAAMMGIKGSAFRVILAGNDNSPSHVFTQVLIGGSWVSVDITNPKEPFGWMPPFKNYWIGFTSDDLCSGKKLKMKKIKL